MPATPTGHYWTRFFVLRLLGLVYTFAFLSVVLQWEPLLGAHGLTPVRLFLPAVAAAQGTRWGAFLRLPSLFWWRSTDAFMLGCGWAGLALSLALLLGATHRGLLLALWALYLSFVHVGQVWYGYGWEFQLCETGFLAAFLAPWRGLGPFPEEPAHPAVVWLMRWLIFRVMLGAALIKLRGDACWRDLTCLYTHFETQPLPNPLSRWFDDLPHALLRGGVLFNFAAELVVPWFALAPWAAVRAAAGIVMAAFQGTLILSGNLSFLNWLTLVPILACFDDRHWRRLLPERIYLRAVPTVAPPKSRAGAVQAWLLVALVGWLSVAPVRNLLSARQAMNATYDPLDLVNTYGAFGSVGTERLEVVLQGTRDADPGPGARWVAYAFKCQPGPLNRRPCVCAPYQYRLDWQAWFAAMERPGDEPWIFPLIWKLLRGDPGALGLFAGNPFPQGPPRWIRVRLFRYRFAPAGGPGGLWWTRRDLGGWLPPLGRDDPRLRAVLLEMGREDLL